MRKSSVLFLCMWTIVLFAVVIASVFLHETGHGIGAKIDGIHVSTGFNRVGNPGLAPSDPDFRSGMAEGVWSGLLGPMTTWLLAIAFTIWLYRFQQPTRGALLVGAPAIVNGLARALPLLMFVNRGLRGQLWIEDEVGWGIWYVTHFLRRDLATSDMFTLVNTQPTLLLSFPAVWIPPLISLAISLACLIPAYRRVLTLWRSRLESPIALWLLGLLPPIVYIASFPVLNVLDQLIRINW